MLEAIFLEGIDEITVHGLTQWDIGQKIQITIPNLSGSFQVHFANKRAEVAYVVEATATDGNAIVAIPNSITYQRRDAVAWVYWFEGDSGETIKTINLPIQARSKPSGYAYTESEILGYKALEQRIASLENDESGGGGLTTTAISLLINILRNAVYINNQSANITALATALAESGSSSGGSSGGNEGDSTVTDDITVTDGVMTINSVGSTVSATDGVLTIT